MYYYSANCHHHHLLHSCFHQSQFHHGSVYHVSVAHGWPYVYYNNYNYNYHHAFSIKHLGNQITPLCTA